MSKLGTKLLLVTANVGSIFEDTEDMLKIWMSEFLATVKNLSPDFLAVHCQEVGGKNYEDSMQHVNHFIKMLLASEEMQGYDKARLFLDEDFTAVDKFTALGCLYFIHESIENVNMWDFDEMKFVPVEGREVLSGNIENITIKEKAKFPQEFFPDFKWSRKGFIRTRWNVRNNVFDLINIHLFHDASNFVAMADSPSSYSGFRCKALRHTIERFETDRHQVAPFFLFGDFNFRLDTNTLIQRLTAKTKQQCTANKKNETSKISYISEPSNEVILTIEKKGFDHYAKHSEVFSSDSRNWLKEYDIEPRSFHDKLYEFDVNFAPSYPYSEDTSDGRAYMRTRCPSWCDRIMLSHSARDLLSQDASPPVYGVIGPHKCMGDHKPIYLDVRLPSPPRSAGNAAGAAPPSSPAPLSSVPLPPAPAAAPAAALKPSVRKMISINGEEMEDVLDSLNIHDYATFAREQHLSEKFRRELRRHGDGDGRRSEGGAFRLIVKDVMRAENVLIALKHYSHRSDSESDSEDGSDSDAGKARDGNGGKKSGDSAAAKAAGDGGAVKAAAVVVAFGGHAPPPAAAAAVNNNNQPKAAVAAAATATAAAVVALPPTASAPQAASPSPPSPPPPSSSPPKGGSGRADKRHCCDVL